MLNTIIGIVPFLIIISLIVSFHELGHYWIARLFKTRVERCSLGFGKILWRVKDKNGTEWCVSALPLGGYVKFVQAENTTAIVPSQEELDAWRQSIIEREGPAAVDEHLEFKPLWQRALIVIAGPVANFILAIFVFAFIFGTAGEQIVPTRILEVVPGSPAAAAGFQVGDVITAVDGKQVRTEPEVRMLIMLRGDTETRFQVERGASQVEILATPRRVPVDPNGPNPELKVGQLGLDMRSPPVRVHYNPIEALLRGNDETWRSLDANLTYISRIFTGKENGNQIGGIVGMTKTAGDVTVAMTQYEAPLHIKVLNLLYTYLQYMAYISVGVGFLNLLPIPRLDGGQLVFFLWEGVTRKPISAEIQGAAFQIAVVLVLGLMTFAFWNDINNHGLVKFIGGLFS